MELDIVQLISTVGFPIAITIWFMVRTERVIERNTEAVERMNDAMQVIILREK